MLAAGALAVGGVLAGCSSASPAASGSSSTTSTSTSTTSVPTTSSTSTSTTSTSTTTTVAATTACTTTQLKVSPDKSQGAAGTIDMGYTIANTGPGSCTVNGYPSLTLVPQSGSVSPVVSHGGQAQVFSVAPSTVTLPPTGSVSAGFVIEYSDVQTNGQTSCPQINVIEVTLPGSAGPYQFSRRFYPCGAPNLSVSAVVTHSTYQAKFANG